MDEKLLLSDYINQLDSFGECGIVSIVDTKKMKDRIMASSVVIKRTKRGIIAMDVKNGLKTLKDEVKNTYNCYIPLRYHGFYCNIELRFYPTNINHVEIISNSNVKGGGPWNDYPGSAAVLRGHVKRDIKGTCLTLDYVQYTFKQGSPKTLTRDLVSKYMQARKHLIESALNFSLGFAIRRPNIFINRQFNRKGNIKDLEEIITMQKFSKLKIIYED